MMKYAKLLVLLAALAMPVGVTFAQDGDAAAAEAPAPTAEVTSAPAPGGALGTPEGDGATTEAPTAEGTPVAEGENGEEEAAPPKKSPFGGSGFLFIIAGVFIVMMVLSSRSRKKQESKRREMLSTLQKGDKVTSIGGICGTVIETKEDEVVVKVDETNNIRMRFAVWAIRGVGETAKDEKQEGQR
jgi:preprotein translocase subunit YajC